jgi:hypothetical protein
VLQNQVPEEQYLNSLYKGSFEQIASSIWVLELFLFAKPIPELKEHLKM